MQSTQSQASHNCEDQFCMIKCLFSPFKHYFHYKVFLSSQDVEAKIKNSLKLI